MSESRATRTVVVVNPQGLHARPADQLARLAGSFACKIELIKNDERVDGKSVLNILTLAAVQGTQLVFEAEGEDAERAVAALAELVESGFDENEVT
jgi:phosphotransferase system HPr (HPr) family protein